MRMSRGLCVVILASFLYTVNAAWKWKKANAEQPVVELSIVDNIIKTITDVFVEAENFMLPIIPIPISFLDTVLALDTCYSYRKCMKAKHPWLQVFVSCLIGCFGGTTMTALLLGQPPGWLGSLTSPAAYLLGFWLIFCCPGNIVYKIMDRLFIVRFILGIINCISGAHGVTSWGAEKALNSFHLNLSASGSATMTRGSGPFTLLCGTLSGCGGGLLAAWLHANGSTPEWSFQTPPVLKDPSTTVRLAFLSSLTYYALRNPHNFLPWGMDVIPVNHAKVVIWGMWVAVLCLGELARMQRPLDWVYPAFSKVTLIPLELEGEPADGIFEKIFGGKQHSFHATAALASKTKSESKKTK